MIAHITHGDDVGGVVDYLTNEATKSKAKEKPATGDKEAKETTNASTAETLNFLQSEPDLFRGKSADGHSQYPRRTHADDIEDDYKPNRRWRVIGGNLSANPREAVRELDSIIAFRPDIKKPVWHASLSAHPDEKITAQQWRAIGRRFLDEMDFRNAPFLLIQHRDREQDHVHIVTSVIDVFGNINNGWREQHRGQAACQKIEDEFDLRKAPREKAKKRNKIKQTFYKSSARAETRAKIDEVLLSMEEPNVAEFVRQLEERQVLVGGVFSRSGRTLGLSYAVREKQPDETKNGEPARRNAEETDERKQLMPAAAKPLQKKNSFQMQSETKREAIPATESAEINIISFKGSKLGEDYNWKVLKSTLNYERQDDKILKEANARARRNEFRAPAQICVISETPETETQTKRSIVSAPVSTPQEGSDARFEESSKEGFNETKPASPSTQTQPAKSFFGRVRGKIQAYIPAKVIDDVAPPIETAKNAYSSISPAVPEVANVEKSREEEPDDEKQKVSAVSPISAFDLAMEKHQMAAAISEICHENGSRVYDNTAEEVLALNNALRARQIYAQFFFDNETISGIRFSKIHSKSGALVTFKGSELNVVTLQPRENHRRIERQAAAAKNLFADRILLPEEKEQITAASKIPRSFRDCPKPERNTVFQANAIDEKVTRVFNTLFQNSTLSNSEGDKDIKILERVKLVILRKAKDEASAQQTEQIEEIRTDVESQREAVYRKPRKQKSSEKIDIDKELDSLRGLREKTNLLDQPLKTGLDAELLITALLPKERLQQTARDLYKREYNTVWRLEPFPPPAEQGGIYCRALGARLRERNFDPPSETFKELLTRDINNMLNRTFVKNQPDFSGELNNFLTPEGAEIARTIENIKETGGWKKYHFDERLDSRMNAAVFILTNGNEEQKNALIDEHLDSLAAREAEAVESRQVFESENLEIKQSKMEQLEI